MLFYLLPVQLSIHIGADARAPLWPPRRAAAGADGQPAAPRLPAGASGQAEAADGKDGSARVGVLMRKYRAPNL